MRILVPVFTETRASVYVTQFGPGKVQRNPVWCDGLNAFVGDVLIRQIIRVDKMPEVKDFPSCKCVDECIDYMLEAFGKEVYEVMNRKGRGFK